MADGNAVFVLLFQTLTMLLLLACGQRTLEWPWAQARVKYTGSVGIHSSKGDVNLSTVVMHGTETYLENEWSWDKDEADDKVPRLWGKAGKEIKIGCRMINGSTHEKASQISVYNITSNPIAKTFRLGKAGLLVQFYLSCLWAHHSVGLSFKFKIDSTEPSTTTSALMVKDKKILSPQISEAGLRDVTSIIGTGLGVLNSIDAEVLVNKLGTTTSDLNKLEHTLQSSLLALGSNQWLLSDILPQWEKINERNHQLIVDALGVAQNNLSLALSCIQAQLWMQSMVIWDNATKFEKEFQSWWYLVNYFTYDPINNKATAFVLTIHNASKYTIYPIRIVLGLNHNGTIFCPLEHRVWAQRNRNKWQTVDVNACIVWEQQGFICESNTIKAQDICFDTEQNICHFEIQPNETPETVLLYIGKDVFLLFITSYQLLQSNYTLSQDLLPTPIGMNLTLVKKLLQHDDLFQLLECIQNNGQKTLITIHRDAEERHYVLERVKKDAEHH
ncbi:hypothetical protein QYF61_021073 [Mycteria americana]|uniref:Uncharacterized protein n=1 Tax=Mycteria americana TaxID=33587 RepID=A0AAN7S5D2_MYCAM|nr:hypothetical protein QYF61_021073 [Mycteria americana]